MKVRIKNNNTVYIMETIVFIGTVIMCTCIIVISETLDRISSIEKHNKSLETVLQKNYEHIMMCILYTAVHIPETIHGIKITMYGGGSVSFSDVRIVDIHEEPIVYKINQQKTNNIYRCPYSHNNRNLIIEFNPIVFKYIEFDNFNICNMKLVCIMLLLENHEVCIKVKQKQKNIMCNTAAYSSYL